MHSLDGQRQLICTVKQDVVQPEEMCNSAICVVHGIAVRESSMFIAFVESPCMGTIAPKGSLYHAQQHTGNTDTFHDVTCVQARC